MSTTTFPIDYIPSPDPFVEFELWLKKAFEAKEIEPTAMHLATISKEQRPRNRVVLYKGMSQGGLTFFTNYESNKGKELEYQPFAAVTFHWKILELQLRVEGRVQKTTRQESEKYFATRPRESQIGAWVSSQSRHLNSRKDMDQKKIELEEKFKDKEVPCPPFWGGYKITPDLFEFWMCEPGRLHNRFQYTVIPGGWKQERLFP
jgi:pyridoxamine 5'-phosphate oxidase